MKTCTRVALLLILPALLASCSDDGVSPQGFRVVVEVTDTLGTPVAGLDLAVAPDTPYYQDGKATSPKPVVTIPFTIAQSSRVRLAISDIEDREVRLLDERILDPGPYDWQWNGYDDAQQPLDSGVYHVNLRVEDPDTGALIHAQSRPVLMALTDPAHRSVGTTDAEGRIVLDDRRLFPHLFAPPEIPAVSCTGESLGTIRFTSLMRFYLADLVGGGEMRFDREVDGSTRLAFVWNVRTSQADTEIVAAAAAPSAATSYTPTVSVSISQIGLAPDWATFNSLVAPDGSVT